MNTDKIYQGNSEVRASEAPERVYAKPIPYFERQLGERQKADLKKADAEWQDLLVELSWD